MQRHGFEFLLRERAAFQYGAKRLPRQDASDNGVEAVLVRTEIDHPIEMRTLKRGKLAEQLLQALDFLCFLCLKAS